MINWNLLKEKVEKHMNFDSCGHGFDHVERVYNIAQKLMQNSQMKSPQQKVFFNDSSY